MRIDDSKLPLKRLDRLIYGLEGEQQHQKTERFIQKYLKEEDVKEKIRRD